MSGRIRTRRYEDHFLRRGLPAEARVILDTIEFCLADDYGHFPCDAALIRGLSFGDPGPSPKSFRKYFRTAIESPFVQVYEVDGRLYGKLVRWHLEQRIDRPSRPKFPAPPTAMDSASVSGPTGARLEPECEQKFPVGSRAGKNFPLQHEPSSVFSGVSEMEARECLARDSDMEMEREIERVFSRACAEDLDFGSLIEEAELEGHIPPATDRSSGIMRAAPRTPPDEPSPPEPPQGSDPEAIAPSWPESAPAIAEVEDVLEVVDIEEVVGEPVDLPLSRTPQPVGTVRQDLVVDGRHVTVYAAAPAPAPTVWGTPPPDDLPISTEFADGCVMAGLPRPTSLHVAAMLDWHRANGKTSADWYASLRTWMRREGTFGSRWGGPMKARAQVFEVAPPPEPLTPEELANAPTKSFSEMTKREQWEHYRKMSEEQLYGKSA